MPITYEPLASTTLTSASSSITFSGIPSTYTDLKLVFIGGSSGSSFYLRFNNDSATNYSRVEMNGSGSAVFGSGGDNSNLIGLSYTNIATTPQMYTVDIFSYTAAIYKTVLTTGQQNNVTEGQVGRNVGLWKSTSPITSVTLLHTGANTISAGGTMSLYGILKA